MTVRIVVTGPEASGKTTLALELATALGAPATLEAARLYAESSPGPLTAATVEPIARLSMEIEDEVIASDRPRLLVRDTDLVSTVVYARHYYGAVPDWIVAEAAARRGDLYLLCLPDLPWLPDGVRDRPRYREAMFEGFERALGEFGARVVPIRGAGPARLAGALGAVRDFLATVPAESTDRPPDPAAQRMP